MPTPINQLLSKTIYNTDGSTTSWEFAFSGGYISQSHVKAQTLSGTGGVTPIILTPDNFTGPFTLEIFPALPVGFKLTIFRDTPKDLPLVDFTDSAGFSEIALDTNARQAIFVAAEYADVLSEEIIRDTTELQAAVDASQASAASASASAIAAATSANTAVVAAFNAEASADEAAAIVVSKQDILVSGTNIKTLNGASLLGSGNVAVQPTLVSGTTIKTVNGASLLGSGNVVTGDMLKSVYDPNNDGKVNSAISADTVPTLGGVTGLVTALAGKQDTLVSGTSIKTVGGASLLGTGDVPVQAPLVSGATIKTVNGQTVLGSGNITISGDAVVLANYTALRAYTGTATAAILTDTYQQGVFNRVTSAAADNSGTVIVDSGSRRWLRSFSGRVNAQWFGAYPNGTDAVTGLLAAIAAVNTGDGGVVYVPAGTYVCGSTVIFTLATSASLVIEGDGPELTIFHHPTNLGWYANYVNDGWWTGNPSGNSLTIRDFTISAGSTGGEAFHFQANAFAGRPTPPTYVERVVVRGDDTVTALHAWSVGLSFVNCQGTNVYGYQYFGRLNTFYGIGILYTGDTAPAARASVEHRIVNSGVTYCSRGMLSSGHVEGIHITNCDIVNSEVGVEITGGGEIIVGVPGKWPEIGITNSHVYAETCSVFIVAMVDVHLVGNSFFSNTNATVWSGVTFNQVSGTISANAFAGNGANKTGINILNVVDGGASWYDTKPVSISGNIFRGLQTGVALFPSAKNVTVSSSNAYSSEVTHRVQDSSAGSYVERRTFADSVVLNLGAGAVVNVDVPIPAGIFSEKALAATLENAHAGQILTSSYLYDDVLSTPTNARFEMRSLDGAPISAGVRRFSFNTAGK